MGHQEQDCHFDPRVPPWATRYVPQASLKTLRTKFLLHLAHPPKFFVAAWNRSEWQLSCVAGGYEPSKHDSSEHAAKCELEEEARLVGGTWIPLLSSSTPPTNPRATSGNQGDGTTVAHDKYSTNRFFPWLALDCEVISEEAARPRDDEELILVESGVTEKQLREMVNSAELNVPSSYAVLLALGRLEEMNLL